MKEVKLSKKEEEKDTSIENTVISTTAAVGIGAGGAMAAEEVSSWELDLVKTKNEAGYPTGHGNMFETVLVRENPGSVKVNNPGSPTNPLLREKAGVDIQLADGTDIQAKCCRTPEGAVKGLMENGHYKYVGQEVYVPKGQGKAVRRLLKKAGVDVPVRESIRTYDEVLELCQPGWASIKFDATNPKVLSAAGFMGVIAGGCAYAYIQVNHPDQPVWKKALKAAGIGIGTFGAVELAVIAFGQLKRL